MIKIDLHGLTHDKAILKVEDCLIMNQFCTYGEIEVITGKSPALQDKIIKEILGPNKFSYYIPPHNTGVILIADNELV